MLLEINKISFPGLKIPEFEINSLAIDADKFKVAWYAIIIAIGMVAAVAYIIFRASKIGISLETVIDYTLFVIPISIIGCRIYYVIFEWQSYKDNFLSVFKIWEGGLAIYGGLIAGTLVVLVVSLIKKIPFPAIGDCIIPGVILAQGIGRWGNFMNVEAYGSVTDLPWRMCGSGIASELMRKNLITEAEYSEILNGTLGVHPTFFYESVWNVLGFVLANIFFKHRKYDGQITLFVFCWYGLGRMFIEGLRTDSLMIGSVRVSQLLAGIVFGVCLSFLIYFAFRKPKKELYYCNDPKCKIKKKES